MKAVKLPLSCGTVFLLLYKVVLTFRSMDEILSVTMQMKATEQYFPVVLFFLLLYKVVPSFESLDEILKCDHSDESYRENFC